METNLIGVQEDEDANKSRVIADGRIQVLSRLIVDALMLTVGQE